MALEPLSRRMLLTTMGAVAGAAALGSRLAMAQTPPPSGPATPLSTVTTPPRDFGPNAPPSTYVDPDVITVDPLFDRYRQGNTPIKRLWTGALWSEGPAWSSQGRYLVWSDIPNNRQLRWLEDDGRVTVFRMPSNNSNGNTFDFQGRQISCEHLTRRVVRYEHDGAVTVIADSYNGKRLNSPNDVVAHPDGSYWFTDPPYGGQLYEGDAGHRRRAEQPGGPAQARLGQPPEIGQPEARAADQRLSRGSERPGRPRDQRGSGARTQRARASRRTTRSSTSSARGGDRATPAREASATCTCSTWAATTSCPTAAFSDFMVDGVKCGPDGVRCDVDGNLWVLEQRRPQSGLQRRDVWTPEGKLIGRIRLPEVCANIAFGGPKRNRLFMAASQSLYALYVATQGRDLPRPSFHLVPMRGARP